MRNILWSSLGFALLTAVLSLSPLELLAAQSEAPFTRAELIAYCQKNVHPWDDSRHQADIQHAISLIEKRGVGFKVSGFDEELHKAGASRLSEAIEKHYRPAGGATSAGPVATPTGAPASSTGRALLGTWSVAVVGQTQHTSRDVTTVSASWGPSGSLMINPDGTYVWNRSESARLRGRWRTATKDEVADASERLVLLHAFEDVDWIVYQYENRDKIIVAQLKALYRREFGSRK